MMSILKDNVCFDYECCAKLGHGFKSTGVVVSI